MNSAIQEEKRRLRDEARSRLRELAPEQTRRASLALVARVRESPWWKLARRPMFFVPISGEPEIHPLIESRLAAGETVLLPRIEDKTLEFCEIKSWEDLTRGEWGLLEPRRAIPAETDALPDLVFVPGIAFTISCARLGRGGGYYDRFLSALPATTPAVGLCLAVQILNSLPLEPHDVILSGVITESACHRPGQTQQRV